MLWFKHKTENVGYEERIKRLELRIGAVETEIINLSAAVSTIRGKVIKKLIKQESEEETKNIYNGMFLTE